MFHKFIRHVPSPKITAGFLKPEWTMFYDGDVRNTKFQNTAGSDILIAKSGFSNHAASNILDDLCFSSLEHSTGVSAIRRQFKDFLCVPCWHH